MTHSEALALLANRSARKVGNNTFLARRDDGSVAVRLHATDVVTLYPDRTVLDSGGWRTVTTKARMNAFAPGVRVFSKARVWYVSIAGAILPFEDGMQVAS